MNILVISVITPFPIDTGGNAGTFKLINESRKKHNVSFISLPTDASKIKGLKEAWPDVKIYTKEEVKKPLGVGQKIKNSLKTILRGKTPINKNPKLLLNTTNLVECHYTDFVENVKAVVSEGNFDLIQVEFIELAPIVYFLPREITKIFVHHELRFRRMEYEYGLLPQKNLEDLWKIAMTKELEIGLMNAYDGVLTVSEIDSQLLEENGVRENKIFYSPSPIALNEHDLNKPFKFKNKLVYLGPEAHYPNEDGVRWFLETIWPKLSLKYPELEFQIAGKWSQETIDSLPKSDRVKFLGFVDNLADIFDGSIMVVPLRIGGGMRMKILEGISWGTPVITTTIGAEGLPLINKENSLIANNSEEFIQAIDYVKSENGKIDALIDEAKNTVKNQFTPEKCSQIREEYYTQLTDKKLHSKI